MVLLHNSLAGCAGDVAELQDFTGSLPIDPHCAAPIRNRTLIIADPLVPADVRIAAVACGFIHTASCVDTASLSDFVTAHYGISIENTCAEGDCPESPATRSPAGGRGPVPR